MNNLMAITPINGMVQLMSFTLTGSSITGLVSTSGAPVVINWGDGTTTRYNGANQNTSHTYAGSDTYTVKILSTKRTALTRFDNYTGNISFALAVVPASVTVLYVTSANTISGALSDLPASLARLVVTGSNTISGALSGLPSTVTYVELYGSNTVSGDLSDVASNNFTHFVIGGSTTITGDIAHLAATINSYIVIYGSNTVYGDVNDIAGSPTYISIAGSNTISGNIINLPAGCTSIELLGANTLIGNIEDIPASYTAVQLQGSNTVAGDVGLTTANYTILYMLGTGGPNAYTSRAWANGVAIIYLSGSLSTAEVDQLLIDLSAVTFAGDKLINLANGTNGPRSAASDAAVTSLQAQGITVTTF